LVNSGRINKKGNASYTVSFGGDGVKYAKRRHYENKLNPQTLLYLEKAGDGISRSNLNKYIRD
ncbi:MAG TPA: hypothetical protein VL020_04665, partial [Pseudomonadales bacterium]|nr:hypothetical protein [Pseudomonadales bacterium]